MGEPETTPRLDNIHRFLAGLYLGCGLICVWIGITIRKEVTLLVLICIADLLGRTDRIISMMIVGIPGPNGLWLAYARTEIVFPLIAIVALWAHNRSIGKGA